MLQLMCFVELLLKVLQTGNRKSGKGSKCCSSLPALNLP